MPTFAIYSKGVLVGHSQLERGDAPMGVVSGTFAPTELYDLIRDECISNHRDQSGLELTAHTEAGLVIECVGVSVLDYSELGDGLPIEVNVLGIPYPLYGELFPHHVKAYEDLWKDEKDER